MKKAIGGIVIICVLLLAFVVAKPYLFGEDKEAGNQVAESSAQSTDVPESESVIASAVNPTKAPVSSSAEGADSEIAEKPSVTAEPTEVPTVEPTAVPTAEPTATPAIVEIPEPTKVPAPVSTATPALKPEVTAEPVEEGVSDEDIAYVAELLEIPVEKVQEVVDKAEEAGYVLDPNAIMNGEVDVKEMWGIVTEVFGPMESAKLLLKVMQMGFQ